MSLPKAKRCPRCSQVKPAGQFYRRRRSRRLSPYCQPRTRAASRLARQRRRRALGGPGPSGGDAA
jgi:hypothetical protein